MNKQNVAALDAFAEGKSFRSNTCSVRLLPASTSVCQLFSYDLLIGVRYQDGKVSLLPIPKQGASKEEGGSKTTRTLIYSAMGKFPKAVKLTQFHDS